jgi:hypothetical protein
MTRKLANSVPENVSGNPMFDVDSGGNITPTGVQQEVLQGGTILIQAKSEPAAPAPYSGYVCAWWNGACRCASLVTDLGTEKHMKVRGTPYNVAANAPEQYYTLYTTSSDTGPGPNAPVKSPDGSIKPFTTNGQLHVGH